MIINHKSNAETAGKSPHRPGGIHFHYLLTGEDGAQDNYVLALVETTEDYYTPRHHHNFEQVRLMLKGTFEYESGHIQKEGSVGYFGEGTHYAQKGLGRSVALILQVGGPSGQGFMSHKRLREGSAELAKVGSFKNGIYTWINDEGRKCNKDGYEATWEYVMGSPVNYPAPRYERPVVFFPGNFNYLPLRSAPGVLIKDLGRFNERGLAIKQVQLEAGTTYALNGVRQSHLYYVNFGEGTSNNEPWGAASAFQIERDETVTIVAETDCEFFVVGLPVFDD